MKNSKLIKNSFISITEKNNIRHPYVFVLKYSQLLHMPLTEKTCHTGVPQYLKDIWSLKKIQGDKYIKNC